MRKQNVAQLPSRNAICEWIEWICEQSDSCQPIKLHTLHRYINVFVSYGAAEMHTDNMFHMYFICISNDWSWRTMHDKKFFRFKKSNWGTIIYFVPRENEFFHRKLNGKNKEVFSSTLPFATAATYKYISFTENFFQHFE